MRLGNEFQINTYTTGNQGGPTIGSDGSGAFVVAWSSYGSSGTDDYWHSVQAQRYIVPTSVFADGFESGNTAAWTVTIP